MLSLSGGGGVFGGGGSRERVAFARKVFGGEFYRFGGSRHVQSPRVFVFRVLLLVFVIGQKFMRLEEGRRKAAFVRYARNDEVRAP